MGAYGFTGTHFPQHYCSRLPQCRYVCRRKMQKPQPCRVAVRGLLSADDTAQFFSVLLFCAQQIKDRQYNCGNIAPRKPESAENQTQHSQNQKDHAKRAALRQFVLQAFYSRNKFQNTAKATNDDGKGCLLYTSDAADE